MLSPYITLYFKGGKKHSSNFSSILSIFTYVIVFIAAIYYIIDFINKNDPIAYFFNRYVEDAGNFPLNSSSMFNFIQLKDIDTNEALPFDYSKVRVIGFDDVEYGQYMENPDIVLNANHWVYGYCNNNSDTEGISYLIDFDNYEKSSCIRKYYDKNTKQYYNTGEKGFRWPVLEKGCSHPKRTYYGIILQRCDKVSESIRAQNIECSSEKDITDYINKISLDFEIIDSYPDILNYRIPLTKYFYSVTSAISNGVYIVNHLNFNPVRVITHNGIFFDNIVEEYSYIFVQNEKHTIDSSSLGQDQTTNGCLIGIYFWMQNTLQYYERVYSRLQDNLSYIGGIYSVVESVAYILNLLVHSYIILLDTEDLVINEDKSYYTERNMSKRPTIFRNANLNLNPPRRHYAPNKKKFENNFPEDQRTSNNQRFILNYPDNSNNNSKRIIDDKDVNIYFDNLKRIDNINIVSKSNNIRDKNYTKNYRNRNNLGFNINENKSDKNQIFNERFNQNKEERILDLRQNSDNIDNNSPIEKINYNCIKYLWKSLPCRKNDKKIDYYENFRSKLISEESIIQNYLDIYKLLELNNLLDKKVLLKKD